MGRAFTVSCFYAVVVRGSHDGQANVDDVDRDFWRLLAKLKYGMYQGYGVYTEYLERESKCTGEDIASLPTCQFNLSVRSLVIVEIFFL